MRSAKHEPQEAPEELMTRLRSKLFQQAIKILAIFTLPAIIGTLVGYIIDQSLGLAPWGTIAVLLIMFTASWWFTIRTINELNK